MNRMIGRIITQSDKYAKDNEETLTDKQKEVLARQPLRTHGWKKMVKKRGWLSEST